MSFHESNIAELNNASSNHEARIDDARVRLQKVAAEAAGIALAIVPTIDSVHPRAKTLTSRLSDHLDTILEGRSIAEAAKELHLSEATIRSQRGHLYGALGVKSAIETIAKVNDFEKQALIKKLSLTTTAAELLLISGGSVVEIELENRHRPLFEDRRERVVQFGKQGGYVADIPPPGVFGVLSPRELDVMGALGLGYSNKEIAMFFSLSEQAIKFNLHNAFQKLGVTNRVQASNIARAHGLLEWAEAVSGKSARTGELMAITKKLLTANSNKD